MGEGRSIGKLRALFLQKEKSDNNFLRMLQLKTKLSAVIPNETTNSPIPQQETLQLHVVYKGFRNYFSLPQSDTDVLHSHYTARPGWEGLNEKQKDSQQPQCNVQHSQRGALLQYIQVNKSNSNARKLHTRKLLSSRCDVTKRRLPLTSATPTAGQYLPSSIQCTRPLAFHYFIGRCVISGKVHKMNTERRGHFCFPCTYETNVD